jgi:hypothetical protein
MAKREDLRFNVIAPLPILNPNPETVRDPDNYKPYAVVMTALNY